MIAINRLRTPPVMVGLFLVGLLLFAVVGIVRNAVQANGAVVSKAVQSNVVRAVALPVQPTAIQGTWLKTQIIAESRWVYADYWFDCRYVAGDGSEYAIGAGYAVGGFPGNAQYQALQHGTRVEIARICYE